MKKTLLVFLTFLCLNLTYSQTIEIVGKGITEKSEENLTFSDIETIDSVVVGAVYKGKDFPVANDVLFSGSGKAPFSELHIDDIVVKDRTNLYHKVGYYTGTFEQVDANGVNVSVIPTHKVHSFYAFVHRNNPDAEYKSYQNSKVSFFYQNGKDNAEVYNIPIAKAPESRKVVVKMVVSELDAGPRDMVIDITAGSIEKHYEETTFNKGEALLLKDYVIEDVPGDVDNIAVSVYSPVGNGRNGDSFLVSSVVVDVEKVGQNCTSTAYYWKNHTSDADDYDEAWALLPNGENTSFFKSNKTYLEITGNRYRRSYYYSLAKEYAAAELNILRGANNSEIAKEFTKAKEILEYYTPRQLDYYTRYGGYYGRCLRNYTYKLIKKLRAFNDGAIGPGACEEEPEDNPCLTAEDVLVYPNPMSSYGKIKFTSKQDGRSVVRLYNSRGRCLGTLYNRMTYAGDDVKINVNAYRLRNGIYYVKIWNGCCLVTKKVVVCH